MFDENDSFFLFKESFYEVFIEENLEVGKIVVLVSIKYIFDIIIEFFFIL